MHSLQCWPVLCDQRPDDANGILFGWLLLWGWQFCGYSFPERTAAFFVPGKLRGGLVHSNDELDGERRMPSWPLLSDGKRCSDSVCCGYQLFFRGSGVGHGLPAMREGVLLSS